jgi:hypothetical protein
MTAALLLVGGCSRDSSDSTRAGLIACWPGETGAAHPAVMTGAVAAVRGKFGPAYSFDGSGGHVRVPNAPALNFGVGEDFSISAWIQPMRLETSYGVMPIVDKRKVNGVLGALGYALALEYGHLSFQLAPAAPVRFKFTDLLSPARIKAWWQQRELPPNMAFARFVAPEPDLRDGRFHHVVVTVERRSRTGGRLYVDGRVVLRFDPTGQLSSLVNREPLLIGGHPDPALHCPYKGIIEDARLYSRALSAAEVEALDAAPAR